MEKRENYTRGKNPNSLKNLQRGKPFDKERAAKAGQMSAEAKKFRKSIMEIMSGILQEQRDNLSMSKIEAILRKYIDIVTVEPTYKDILALQKILGEDVQKVEVEQSHKYEDIEVTENDKERALAMLFMRHEKTRK